MSFWPCCLCWAWGAISCSEQPLEQSGPRKTIITATLGGNGNTKTGIFPIDDVMKVAWMQGDEISVFYENGYSGGSLFTCMGSGITSDFWGTLSAVAGDIDDAVSNGMFWGLYPYNDNAFCDGTSIYTALKTDQSGIAGTFDTDLAVAAGISQTQNITFKNTNAIFAFKLTRSDIHRVKFYGNGGEPLSGNYSISFEKSGKVDIIPGEDAADYVSVTPKGKSFFNPGVWYYIVSLPAELSKGFSIDFETLDKVATYTTDEAKNFEASTFYTITDRDSGLTFVPQKNVYIPDEEFKAYLVENFDTDRDGEISYAEAAAVTEIDAHGLGIETVEGIHAFTSLRRLLLTDNSLTFPEFNCCPTLETLDVSNNRIERLDVSGLTKLKYLGCAANKLSNIDLSKNTALVTLSCGYNSLYTLNVSENKALESLSCQECFLYSLDLSENTKLARLWCASNQLYEINLTKCPDLTDLNCGSNYLKSLDVSKNVALMRIICGKNRIASLDLSKNVALMLLECLQNQLTDLDVSACTDMYSLNCQYNLIRSLDLTKNTALDFLCCGYMDDADGNNTLEYVYLSEGTELPYITGHRISPYYIPAETNIVWVGTPGTSESYTEGGEI